MILEPRIHLLPEHLIDQIKAGEVVERPSSVVKELLENSLDAGSTEISIDIRDSGLDLIAIRDNGQGMFFEEQPYAFCRHATSKINRFEDLYNLHSYGFRGEALASIASVARVSCHSTPKEDLNRGGKIEIHSGQTISHTLLRGESQGTSIQIRDLFYKTPARLKFIKSKTSEKNALRRTVYAFLLTNPEVSFTLQWDQQDKEFYLAGPNAVKTRFSRLISKRKLPPELISFEGSYGNIHISGMASKECSSSPVKSQYLFANGRMFTDRVLHQCLISSLEQFWNPGQFGHYILSINLSPEDIDVNVHPNKTQIKFFDLKSILALIRSSIAQLAPIKPQTKSNDIVNNSHAPIQVSEAHPTELLKISDEYSIFYPYLVHRQKALNYFIHTLFEHFRSEEEITPLLIGEKITVEESISPMILQKWERAGLHLDAISSKDFILRTSPTFCFGLALSPFIKGALGDEFQFTDDQIDKVISLLIKNKIIDSSFSRTLESIPWNSLFYGP